MKILKKILRIITILLPVFACVLFPGSVFAKKYSVDSFSAYSYSAYAPNHSPSNDGLVPVNSVPQIWLNDITDVSPRHIPFLVSSLSGDKCQYDLYSNSYYTSTNSFSFSRSYLYPDSVNLFPAVGSTAICRSLAPYSSIVGDVVHIPDFNYSSVPENKKLNVSSLVDPHTKAQYNSMYSQFGFRNTRTLQGIEYDDTFLVSDLLNSTIDDSQEYARPEDYKYYSNRITRFSFPINFNPTEEFVNANSTIEIRGKYYAQDGLLRSTNTPFIVSRFLNVNTYEPTTITTTCVMNPFQSIEVEFLCTINVPFTTNMYGFDFIVNGSSSFDVFNTTIIDDSNADEFDVNGIGFETFYITLNNDDTDGGSGSFDNLGSYPNIAPGVPQGEANPDWLSSLLGLFDFSFVNPFNAIFGLFTPSTECKHIPIIANFIHLENDEICPIYPSAVYFYLTPVFSIITMMILMSYLMKWLRDDDVYIMGGIK